MKDLLKENNQKKHQFKTIYCGNCKQRKSCGKLDPGFCCSCQLQMEQQRAAEYSSYQQVYQRKVAENKKHIQQLKLLRNYQVCKKCSSKEADAYSLYEENKLICWTCLIKKEGGASSTISFPEKQKWFKRCWKIDLGEWLERYGCLPVNPDCAREWLEDNNHRNNCRCLEQEAQETYLLFSNSLKKKMEKLKGCQCETSPKWRIDYIDSAGSGWIYCEGCEARIESAGHHGVIKNRNDPRFWGLETKEKVLCGNCLEKSKEKMTPLRRAEFNRYRKVGRL